MPLRRIRSKPEKDKDKDKSESDSSRGRHIIDNFRRQLSKLPNLTGPLNRKQPGPTISASEYDHLSDKDVENLLDMQR
ncbi:hypothetical protein SARC_15683, partial [Sphaeroforma arctica JP610]